MRFVAHKLLSCLRGKPGVSMGYVQYLTTKDLEQARPSLNELPFLKRRQFADEQEFRFIYEDASKTLELKDYLLDLNSIYRVILSPWLPHTAFESLRDVVHGLPGCSSVRVRRSNVVDDPKWKDLAK